MYTCNNCDKEFTSANGLSYHNKHKSCKLVKKINCVNCDKTFTSYANMRRHVRTTCKGENEQMEKPIEMILIDEYELNRSNKKSNQTYRENQKYQRDQRNSIYNDDYPVNKQEIYEQLLELKKKVGVLEEENTILKTKIDGKKIINNNINKGIINNNVVLVSYGKEDMDRIDKSYILNALKNGYNSTLKLTEAIHFNPQYPEYHNVYISSMKNKYGMIYDGTDWKLVTKSELINKIYDDKKDYIEENLEDFVGSMTISQKKALERWLDTGEDNNKIKKIREQMKLLLYNNRNIVLNTSKDDKLLEYNNMNFDDDELIIDVSHTM